jgi:uncharacterized membrane protein
MQTQTNHSEQTLHIELFIARLLRWGVLLSFIIVAIGIGIVIVTGNTGYQAVRLDDLNSIVQYRMPPDFPNTLGDMLNGVLALRPYAIIALGLVILIAIPVLRVAVSVIAFAVERDWLYVLITSFVLLILLLSFVIGETGG